MKNILLFVLILLCCFPVAGQSKKAKKTVKKKSVTTQIKPKEESKSVALSSLTGKEYAVFMAVLGKDRGDFVVINKIEGSKTIDSGIESNSGIENLKATFEELNIETVKDFALRNTQTALIEKKFPTKKNYFLISDEEVQSFFDIQHNWKNFYKKYPKSDGLYSFSRVGFSNDGKQAFVSVGHSCGELCGEGKLYLLQKENGEWKVVKEQGTWVS